MTLSRRRLLAVTAAAGGLAMLRPGHAAAPPLRWQGTALGTTASLILHSGDPAHGAAVVGRCLAELARLEGIFSLYEPASALSRLNESGRLDDPPPELADCLARAVAFGGISGGVFDVTVQPLWRLYAGGLPDEAALAAVLPRVGQSGLSLSRERVAFLRPGMAVTLNGIAQGYITDRIVALLHAEGFDNVLVDMGEIAARGGHPDGNPWRVAVAGEALDLRDLAVSTSSGAVTRHLFDPRDGRCGELWRSVSVVAADATTADALSTAAALLPPEPAAACLAAGGALAAVFVRPDGGLWRWRI